jgi:hypothetical protein
MRLTTYLASPRGLPMAITYLAILVALLLLYGRGDVRTSAFIYQAF